MLSARQARRDYTRLQLRRAHQAIAGQRHENRGAQNQSAGDRVDDGKVTMTGMGCGNCARIDARPPGAARPEEVASR